MNPQYTYLRWIDEICTYLERENIAMNAQQIETLFRPQYENKLTPKQAIVTCWSAINQRRLTKY
ncbi:hypothetical protein [Beggiatoa leptomitoformis]|uniref:Uncharacterized protein n=1 Tax=Beggiatoa leptomitoformis TaxID=288004 RepID=A0A2N9YIZ8_9GAMM|nr:hypothetical protein [Beggiatoa leptomitoformis]ALG67382.1 hypothetical protein AL038_06290 [Beggiatoa leptomitoformis]AUI70409.1 hypothetical protein BLE401_18015 [Beggiatoa leptomitoformis]